ncbi:hypothetical protein AM493_17475 [Flavobacterium akiainvivens]|uniref:Uncharacterized protein n=1 Tax=Flavobacterium akiainvivens TaxID=1202724 RepID=A0A0M9VJN1_9FLAO|nr:hypothetical protein AM493_17475 [Flavobacterium akiainvivens]
MTNFLKVAYRLNCTLFIITLVCILLGLPQVLALPGLYQVGISLAIMFFLYPRLGRPLQIRVNYYWISVLFCIITGGAFGGIYYIIFLSLGIALYHVYITYILTKAFKP